jgi:hypothetical protein
MELADPQPRKKRRFEKNYLIQARREKEARFRAECDIDESIIIVIKKVMMRSSREDKKVRLILNDDIGDLWMDCLADDGNV